MPRRDRGSPLSIPLFGLVPATVVARPNRFVAEVDLGGADPAAGGGKAADPGYGTRSRTDAATGRIVTAHVADSGRLKELIFPGNLVMVRRAVLAPGNEHGEEWAGQRREQPGAAQRKTLYDLVLASALEGGDESHGIATPVDVAAQPSGTPAQRRVWVSVDTRYPNMLLGQALRAGALKEFDDTCTVCQEHWYHHLSPWKEEDEARKADGVQRRNGVSGVDDGGVSKDDSAVSVDDGAARRSDGAAVKAAARRVRSRMDFYLDGGSRDRCCLIEVKSVTLCRDGVGLFPDAPTDRGARHLRELARAVEEGYQAYAVFIAQREDIRIIKPNRETDPAFADALENAEKAGVRLLGYRCRITPEEISLDPATIPAST